MSAPILVATREGVLAYAFFALAIGIGLGFALCLVLMHQRRKRPEPTFSDHPDVVQLRGVLKARGRS